MADQDAQDINQMMSASADGVVKQPKKSKFLWVVLGCVVVGVGLGIFVYQQSLKPAPKPSATPRPVVTPIPSPIPSPAKPGVSEVVPVANTITFPKSGKIRVYTDLNNIQMVITIGISGQTKTLTLPNKPVNDTTPMNAGDATFDVTAGSVGTINAYLNSTSGPKMRGWIAPFDPQQKECGIQGGSTSNNEGHLAFVQSKLAGESVFSYQCWEDDDTPGEFNDIYMIWTYVPGSTTVASPSPTGSAVASSSPASSAVVSPSPSPSRSPSPSPSASSTSSITTSTPTPSPRVTMPDTSEGTPVTGVFEVTVGTISAGLLFLILGVLGLLVL